MIHSSGWHAAVFLSYLVALMPEVHNIFRPRTRRPGQDTASHHSSPPYIEIFQIHFTTRDLGWCGGFRISVVSKHHSYHVDCGWKPLWNVSSISEFIFYPSTPYFINSNSQKHLQDLKKVIIPYSSLKLTKYISAKLLHFTYLQSEFQLLKRPIARTFEELNSIW